MEHLSGKRSKKIFMLKIDLPALIAVVFFAGLIFFYLIPGFEKVMMERKRNMIHEITSSAYSLLDHYHSLEMKGTLDSAEAKEQARAAINSIRYGESLKDYFWITDLYPRMIDHPYRPDLNGKDLTGFRDSNGKAVFVEFVKAVSPAGESYVDYMWQWNDDSTRIIPKLSYVRLYEPWGWIIGTGIYIDDVRSEIRRMEFRALIISGLIGLIIIVLLSAITQQSHRLEKKRSEAEAELQKSRELYRTLAEAASEGVIIWSRQGLQANKTLLIWLGYTEKELNGITFHNLLSSPEMKKFDDPALLYDDLGARRFVECTLRMKSGNQFNSHADFSRILLGNMKAVLVVLRPAAIQTSQSGFTPEAPLLKDIGTGFFSFTYGRKSRFINATQPVGEMLGFSNIQQLHSLNLDTFFVTPSQLKAIRAALAVKEEIHGREVLLRHKSGDEFSALISMMVVESASGEKWCEGTIEYLASASSRYTSPPMDLDKYSASYIMETPVTTVMNQPLVCHENMTVNSLMTEIKTNNADVAIVINSDGDPLGIIDAKTVGLRLAEGGSPETDIFRWMSSPPDYIHHTATVGEAFGMIQNSLRKCLVVTAEGGKAAGVITNDNLSRAFATTPALIFSEIAGAGTKAILRSLFLKSRKTAISMILGHADPYSVSLFLSAVADAICQRALTLCLEEAGEPPCSFAFIQTGSAGRREQTLSTDQDNAIIFENCEGEKLKKAQSWFMALGKRVNEMLAETGYRLCKGGNMAGNPKWCQPVDRWKKYFTDWIKTPGPDELLEVSIFFDFRHCYGEKRLTDELDDFVRKDLKANDIFFHHMAAAWKLFTPSVSQLSEEGTDVKRLLMPLTGIIRLYALKYGVTGLSSVERIMELHSGKNLEVQMLRETIRAWKDLTSLRLSHHASCINKDTEPDNIIDFQIADKEKRCFAEQSISIINNLMMKAGSDFYTVTI